MESQQQGLTDADISARFNAWHLDQSVSRRVRIAGRTGVWVVAGNPPSSCASLPLRTGVWVGTGHSGEWQWRVKREDGRDGGLVPASIMEWVDIPSPTRARALPAFEPGKVVALSDTMQVDVQCRCGRTHHLAMPAGEFSVRISEAGHD